MDKATANSDERDSIVPRKKHECFDMPILPANVSVAPPTVFRAAAGTTGIPKD